MSIQIVREVEWDDEIVYSIDFLYTEDLSSGFSFPCNKWGMVDPDIPDGAKVNYRKCVDSENMFIQQGIIERIHNFKIPALAVCECGIHIELDGDTVCHKCEREYNSSGQLLAPRSQWGEETSEQF